MPDRSVQSISCFQWNARSIFTNEAFLIQHLAYNDYRILILQSLNVCRSKLPRLPHFYYPPIHNHISNSKEKINCAIYIREGTEYSFRPSPAPLNLPDLYSCAASVKINNNVILNVVSVYLPKGPTEHNTEWLHSFQNSDEKWLVAGDFNAHSPFWENGCTVSTSNRFIENVVDSSLCLLNDGRVTRIPDVSTHKAGAIDMSLISPQLAFGCTWKTHAETLGSDHLPIIMTLNEKFQIKGFPKDKIPKFNYKFADWNKFRSVLLHQDINIHIENEDNIHNLYSKFNEQILLAAKESIPKCRPGNSTKNNHTGNVWWTKDCEEAVNFKKLKYKEYIKNKTEENHLEMKKANVHSNRVIAKAKRLYWSLFCAKEVFHHKDLQKVWKKFRDVKQGLNLPRYPIKLENNQFPTSVEKAEAFADAFSKTMRLEGLTPECRKFREKKTNKVLHNVPELNDDLYINAPLKMHEINDAISSLANKTSSVGLDAISNEMIKHLPANFICFLKEIFQKIWSEGVMPRIWKQSVIIPILKHGHSASAASSYRPIALTSHVAKLMEKIVLNRLIHFCNKNGIIPNNQAGFQKGRSAIDHVVKLTTQIKHQFARRKSVLATFFDVKKAFDSVWHDRLLYKLKTIGLSGNLYNYIKDFLHERSLQVKVENAYSSFRSLEMGIPQGSVISPTLFNILLSDLPKQVTKNVTVVQYADDLCLWMNASIRKSTPRRTLNYYRKVYQVELDSLDRYFIANGLKLSSEKTYMVLFNNGSDPADLPSFKLSGGTLVYKPSVKFLGVFLTSKMTWNVHIEYLLDKARRTLNFLKIISKQTWSQDTSTLKHLAQSLIRSKLCYGQEAFFSAPKYLLQKLQSIDSKAFKLCLGVPFHASTLETYRELDILPLNDYRKLVLSRYVMKCSTLEGVNDIEMSIKPETHYPKRAHSISFLSTIGSYTADMLEESEVGIKSLAKTSFSNIIPAWETHKANFDLEYTDVKKADQPNILSYSAKMHIQNNYPNHLKVYTDGSLLNNGQSGSAFVIPSLKVEKTYSIGKHRSIFVAEMIAITMALTFLIDIPQSIFQVLLCVDSLSVLQSIKLLNSLSNDFVLKEICHLIHILMCKGTDITFCWIPSHCGIFGNELADRCAKMGARNEVCVTSLNIPYTLKEGYHMLNNIAWNNFRNTAKAAASCSEIQKRQSFDCECIMNIPYLKIHDMYQYRRFVSTFYRLKLDAFRTKYSSTTKCVCGKTRITRHHVLYECLTLRAYLPSLSGMSLVDVFSDSDFAFAVTNSLMCSPVRYLL